MNRRLSITLAAYGVWNQALILFLLQPVKERVSGVLPPEVTVGEVRVLGLSLEGFAVRDPHHAQGWLPQVVFLVLSGLLTYGVFRGRARVRPGLRTVLGLGGAVLLAAGAAMSIGPALDAGASSAVPTYGEWVVRAQLGEVPAAAAQFALCTLWLPVVPWLLVWRYRERPLVRTCFRITEHTKAVANGGAPGGSGASDRERGAGGADHPVVRAPRPVTARERRHLVCAGLIPAVLLAVAGGPVLRHIRVGHFSQDASVTFDPDLWNSYSPPSLIAEWSGILYPALRLRPLRTELVGGWIATLVLSLVFLGALALALRAVATRSADLPRGHPTAFIGLVMKGWYATLLAAVVTAFVDGRLLRWFAPRGESGAAADHLAVALGDAVRFGTAWGWATGLAYLGTVLLMMRRAAPVVPHTDEVEERLIHGEQEPTWGPQDGRAHPGERAPGERYAPGAGRGGGADGPAAVRSESGHLAAGHRAGRGDRDVPGRPDRVGEDGSSAGPRA